MKNSISHLVYFSFLISFIMISCKSQQANNQDESYYILVLLEEGTSPLDFDDFSKITSDKVKRTSRSQNQWMVKHDGSKEAMEAIVEKLSNDDSVRSIELVKEPKSL